MPLTVLLVDDEPLVRAGLRAVLTAQPDIEVVGEAADGAAVIPWCGNCVPMSSPWTCACR